MLQGGEDAIMFSIGGSLRISGTSVAKSTSGVLFLDGGSANLSNMTFENMTGPAVMVVGAALITNNVSVKASGSGFQLWQSSNWSGSLLKVTESTIGAKLMEDSFVSELSGVSFLENVIGLD